MAATGLLHRFLPINIIIFLLLLLPTLTYSVTESEALLKLKESFTNTEDVLDSWAPDTSPCAANAQWQGIVCYNGIVTGLRLGGLGLGGTIDAEALSEIKGLRTMSLVNNNFSGPIPEFNILETMKGIYLSRNQFSGEIPSDFFSKMESLKKVWMNENQFTGKIPVSFGRIPNLLELHLEGNQFSGTIPEIHQPSLVSLNLSNNKLEGEVPESMSKFDASSFSGNAGLCGGKFGQCATAEPPPAPPTSTNINDVAKGNEENGKSNGGSTKIVVAVCVASAVVLLAFLLLFVYRRRKAEQFDQLGKENTEDVQEDAVELNVSEIKPREVVVERPRTSTSSKKGESGSSRKGSNRGGGGGGGGAGGGMAELVLLNEEKGSFGLPDLMKAAAEVLGNGGLGSSYKAVLANGLAVVVKRMREMNAMGKDGFDAQMQRFGRLHHWNILTPLAYHYRKEEKLMIYEYIPNSSLLYILHGDRGPTHAELDWPARLKIIQGTAKGMGYIHAEYAAYDLPHGNLKSSNILVGPDYEPLLLDFAFAPLINPTSVAQALFAYKAPEAAEHGKLSPKCDVYCLGIVILETLTGKFPSQYLSNGKGGIDVIQWVRSAIPENREAELLDPEISSEKSSIGEMEKLLHIGAACTETDPNQRLGMMEAINRIEQIQPVGAGGGEPNRTMQVLPSLRDGYADSVAPHTSHAPTLRDGIGDPFETRLQSFSIS